MPIQMKHTLAIFVVSLLMTGCGNNDAKIQKQVAGKWAVDLGNNIKSLNVINSRGGFAAMVTGFTNGSVIRIEGTFKVEGGRLVETVTKSTSKTEKVPFVVHGQIIRLNSQEMVTKWDTKPVSVVVAARRVNK